MALQGTVTGKITPATIARGLLCYWFLLRLMIKWIPFQMEIMHQLGPHHLSTTKSLSCLPKYSFYFYQAAENALKAETGPITLPTIQARLLQCYFLLGRGRINQAYSIFGIIVTLAYAFGLHRNHTPNGSQDLVDIECNKRVFWSIYVMDKYLSSSLGRPQVLREDDTDQV